MIRLNVYEDYSKIGPHYLMLLDKVRTERYVRAIQETVKPGDVVLDLGCGTGIFSFIAAKAGARRIYAVEITDIIHTAEAIAKKNNLDDKIVFIKEDSKTLRLKEKVDVIMTETIGPFVMEEGVVELSEFGRNNFLKEGGKIIPEEIELYIAPHSDKNLYDELQKYASFWKDEIWGIDYSPCSELVYEDFLHNPYNGFLDKDVLVDEPKLIRKMNLYDEEETDFEETVIFTPKYGNAVYGFAGYFNVKLSDTIQLDTLPGSPLTHWMNPIFILNTPISVKSALSLKVKYVDKDKMWFLTPTVK